MAWVRLDDGFYDHPKVAGLSDGAFRLWLGLLAYCARYRADGVLTAAQIRRVSRARYARDTARHVRDLCARRLLVPIDPEEGEERWRLHDFDQYQPTAEQVERVRQARAEAGRRGGLESGRRRRSNQANGEAFATAPAEPRPVPSRPSSLSTSGPTHQGPVDNEEEGLIRVAREVAAELGRRDASRATGVRSQPAYALRCAATRWDTQRTALVALTRAFPERTIPELADLAEHPAKGLPPLPTCRTCTLRHTAGPCPYADDPPSQELLAAIEAELAGEEP